MKIRCTRYVLICILANLMIGCKFMEGGNVEHSSSPSRVPLYFWKAGETIGALLSRISHEEPSFSLSGEHIGTGIRLNGNGMDFLPFLEDHWDTFRTVISLRGPYSTILQNLNSDEMEDFLENHFSPPGKSSVLVWDGKSNHLDRSKISFNDFYGEDPFSVPLTSVKTHERALCIVLSENEPVSDVVDIVHQLQNLGVERVFYFYKIGISEADGLKKMPFYLCPERETE